MCSYVSLFQNLSSFFLSLQRPHECLQVYNETSFHLRAGLKIYVGGTERLKMIEDDCFFLPQKMVYNLLTFHDISQSHGLVVTMDKGNLDKKWLGKYDNC